MIQKMKLYTKLVIVLLILSLIWIYFIVDLTYYTLFQEKATFFNTLDYSLQFKLVYILGVVLFVSYLMLIFFKRNNKNLY
ncbi:MAG TPA: hypothetical protein DC020_05070 [Flavobacterium sp.]|nr:MAG: hypothetical protein A2X07_00945 [Flavobacteria bacterium GWF1_32_7]HBD26181.1 hypothetical protein [Flavobacterium sp.]